ncbi:kinase-like domain-containing protein [Haematococcus lacustris]
MAGYDKYIRGKVLGKGSFGSAVLVESKVDGKKYVIKEIDISRMPKAERESAEQEAKLLMALNHPNIVRCTECFTHQSKLCIVMDWCSEGDLYSICQKRRGAPLPEDTLQDWLVQISLGLKHVHDRKILHRDIKSQNIFCSAGGLLKLGDFGVSKVLSSTWQLAATAVGTPYYLSPEICQNRKYNQKSDIWSLGCVMYELSVGRHAFEAPNMRALIQKIIKGQYTPIPATRSKELRDLIDRMLTVNW